MLVRILLLAMLALAVLPSAGLDPFGPLRDCEEAPLEAAGLGSDASELFPEDSLFEDVSNEKLAALNALVRARAQSALMTERLVEEPASPPPKPRR